MAITVYFHAKGMTLDQFKESHRRLDAVGTAAAAPPGRLHHSCFGDDGDLMVYQIWSPLSHSRPSARRSCPSWPRSESTLANQHHGSASTRTDKRLADHIRLSRARAASIVSHDDVSPTAQHPPADNAGSGARQNVGGSGR